MFLSILPCWHIFERTAEYWCLARGSQMVYSNLRNFKSDLMVCYVVLCYSQLRRATIDFYVILLPFLNAVLYDQWPAHSPCSTSYLLTVHLRIALQNTLSFHFLYLLSYSFLLFFLPPYSSNVLLISLLLVPNI